MKDPRATQLDLFDGAPLPDLPAAPGRNAAKPPGNASASDAPLGVRPSDPQPSGAVPLAVPPARPSTGPQALPPFTAPPPAGRPTRPTAGESLTPCPPTLPAGARWRETATEQQTIGYVLLRSRRRSIGFVIGDDGLRVTAPNWVTLTQVDEAVREKARWILSKLRDWHARRERLAMSHTRWQAGGELPYLGRRIVLQPGSPPAETDGAAAHPASGSRAGVSAMASPGGGSRRGAPRGNQAVYAGEPNAPQDGDTLWLVLPQEADHTRIRDSAQAWLQHRAAAWFEARLQVFLARSGLAIKRWRLSSATTRWGSCTSDGHIMLNWRLIHFAPGIIDYVIAHELAHLREMNHSRDFWAEVEQILPDFQAARDALRRHDPADVPLL